MKRLAPFMLLALLAALPWLAPALGLDYYVVFMCRLVVTMLLATSLNLLAGFGGLVALGHAGFAGVGAYAMAALAQAGVATAGLLWAGGAAAAAIAALLVGAVCLRTQGVYFLMITLAFAQMLYYLAVALRDFGGDDGYTLVVKPLLGFGLDSSSQTALYLAVLALCASVFAFLYRLIDSRFGKALTGMRDNEPRMRALGYPTQALRLQAFVLTAAVAGLCGAMTLTINGFVSPSGMHWSQSAILIVMIVLGGLGHRWGGVLGALAWTCLEETLSQFTPHWHLPMGGLVIAIVLLAPRGLGPLFAWRGNAALGAAGAPEAPEAPAAR